MKNEDNLWFKAILEAMNDMVLVKGENSKLLWANKSFLDYYGMNEEDLQNIIDAPHSDPDNTLQYVIDDKVVFDSGNHLNIKSEEVLNARGEKHFFNTIKSPVKNELNQTIMTVGVSRSLDPNLNDTILIRTEHLDAKAFTAPLRSFSSNFPIPTVLIDINQRIIVCNSLWQNIFGIIEIDHNQFFFTAFEKLSHLKKIIDKTFETQQFQSEILSYDSSQNKRYFDIKCSPWSFKDGSFGGVCIVANEITKLVKANDELGQFAYRISHDLKSPLSTTKALLCFILKDIERGHYEEAKENSTRVIKRITHLESLVADILDLAKADLENISLSSENLLDLVNEVIDNNVLEINEKKIKTQLNIDKSVPQKIIISKTRINQILENLITNAIKYYDSAKSNRFININIKTKDDMLNIIIEDSGLGIPEERKNEVFQMFKRFHPKKAEGNGLGLSIVKKHIDALEGEIEFSSSSEGTLFSINLPLVRSNE